MSILFITQYLFKGKSLARALMDYKLKEKKFKLKGLIVDLGAGINHNYYKFFIKSNDFTIVKIDINKKCKPDIVANLELTFPLKDNVCDIVLAFNIIEHIYNYKKFLYECFRILKGKGLLICYIPFLIRVHGDPYDYYRFTSYTLHNLLVEVGFEDKSIFIEPVGSWIFTVIVNYLTYLPYVGRILSTILYPVAYIIDSLITAKFNKQRNIYPLGYLLYAIKH
jgi:SAM-dependent methyltransferase